MAKYFLLLLFLLPRVGFSQDVELPCDKCLTNEEYEQVLSTIQKLQKQLQSSNEQLKEYKNMIQAPQLELEPISIVVDKAGRVFVRDKINGKLQIGQLSYDVVVKLNTTILTPEEGVWGFKLQYRAVLLQSYELDEEKELKAYNTFGLGLEFFYYKDYNANFVVGPRLYGPMMGVDVTKHMSATAGIGFLYNGERSFIAGLAFDF